MLRDDTNQAGHPALPPTSTSARVLPSAHPEIRPRACTAANQYTVTENHTSKHEEEKKKRKKENMTKEKTTHGNKARERHGNGTVPQSTCISTWISTYVGEWRQFDHPASSLPWPCGPVIQRHRRRRPVFRPRRFLGQGAFGKRCCGCSGCAAAVAIGLSSFLDLCYFSGRCCWCSCCNVCTRRCCSSIRASECDVVISRAHVSTHRGQQATTPRGH